MLKTLFFGTPAIAVPFLNALVSHSNPLGVVTNPDQPAGRGYEVKASAVKEAGLNLSLPVWQPEKASEPGFLEQMKAVAPDVGIVVAYGKLLPRSLLDIPRLGFINVHFSLLPLYRGAAPMQWALINGDPVTGVTLFWLDEGMDTGPLFLQKSVEVKGQNADELREQLVALGVELLTEGLTRLVEDGRTERPQVGTPSRAPMLSKEQGRVDWAASAESIVNRMRGMTPWPGIFTMRGPVRVKILKAKRVEGDWGGASGEIVRLESGEGFVVKCGQDYLHLHQVQPEGKKPMSAWDYWQGARLRVGEKLG